MKLCPLTITILLAATSAIAQHAQPISPISETGQSQFAAIAEIVTTLRADPETDWAEIDINTLRNHLVDMDNVTTKALVEVTVNEFEVMFTVTGDTIVSQSIQRMVLAHSPMLQQATGWVVMAEERTGGATMLVRVDSLAELDQVTGLGFFGIMTVGAHHQQHHMMIAIGHSPH